MTTSGTINTISTVRGLIKGAFELCGVSDNHEAADDYDMALRHLQWMLKSLQADGVNMWRIETISVNWPSGAQSRTFGTDIVTPSNVIDVQDARVVISSTFERTLGRFEYGDYVVMPNKAASGAPTIYTFLKRTGGAKLYMWPVPTETTAINLTIARVIEDVTSINQTVDLPQEWQETIVYNLAKRMLAPFSVWEGQPRTAAMISEQADRLYRALSDADRPASIFMTQWGKP